MYYIVYIYMLMNDSIKLYFFPKVADYGFHALTLLSLLFYASDIFIRSFHEPKYFFGFFFFADVFCAVMILGSAFIENISQWITISFLKILMVCKITKIIFSYKDIMRKRKLKKKKFEEMKKKRNKVGSSGSTSLMAKNGPMTSKEKIKAKMSIFGFGKPDARSNYSETERSD